ncbi:pyridoxal-dependent decarboxylase [Arenibacter sp. GZD96]|uniref:pyridoxal phosphate-dependent decarboxylase family protein n=1 Tax=Aurantibrevibacter litoralis TaxID=3106030 RepID=UPI002B001F9A|nr:pyridoxal-dependent decarboxylase [Arenibacter sp. GZD-96]MEA1786945.1 pyridoxal-dependent decarboxylase [Arenibacter sp. GZD-96]
MEKSSMPSVYDPESFRKTGHKLIDTLADHLDQSNQGLTEKVIRWNKPNEEHEFWKDFLVHGENTELFSEVIKHSTHVHHPNYMGHQVSPTAPITALSGMVSALLNNGMAVYEMGMASSAMERIVTDWLCAKIGFDTSSRGFLTSGGTLANLTALLSARKAIVGQNSRNKGNTRPLGIMVSEQAHYCVDRAAKIMGLGEQGIIKIPTTEGYAMDVSLLETAYKKATKEGIYIFAIVGSAPSTATGIFDDLEVLGRFSKAHNLWFHVDGAHGGAGIFSTKYKFTVKGIHQADSVVIDGHKMLMLPTITTALLFKNGTHSHATFSQTADYLLVQSSDEDWYNLAKRTFECTKSMMSMHWYTLLKTYGETIFDEYLTRLYDLGHQFGEFIAKETDFELAVQPMSNIVCFRYRTSHCDAETLNRINEKIRQSLLEAGEFYIVQTKLRGVHYLRTTLMNPFTTEEHLKTLLKRIKSIALTTEKATT